MALTRTYEKVDPNNKIDLSDFMGGHEAQLLKDKDTIQELLDSGVSFTEIAKSWDIYGPYLDAFFEQEGMYAFSDMDYQRCTFRELTRVTKIEGQTLLVFKYGVCPYVMIPAKDMREYLKLERWIAKIRAEAEFLER